MNRVPQGRGPSMMRELAVGMSVLTVLGAMFVTAFFQRLNDVTSPSPDAIQSIQHAIDPASNRSKSRETKEGQPKIQETEVPVARIADRPTIDPSKDIPVETAEPDPSTFVPNPDTLDSVDPKASTEPTGGNFDANSFESDQNKPVNDDDGAFELDASTFLPEIPNDASTVTYDAIEVAPVHSADDTSPPKQPAVVQTIGDDDERFTVSRAQFESQEKQTYVVRLNDSYFSIAQRVYGDGSLFRALYVANRDRFPNPDSLEPGEVIKIPSIEELQGIEFTAQTRPYTVKVGESLFDIARRELGQAFRYVEILKLNADLPADSSVALPTGAKILLPH